MARLPPPVDHLSHSSVALYNQCGRAWAYRYVEHAPSVPSPALLFGSAAHAAIEQTLAAWAIGQPANPAPLWLQAWDQLATTTGVLWGKESPDGLREQGRVMFEARATARMLRKVIPMLVDGRPVIEKKIELRVPGVPVPVVGYIDVICTDGVPCDFKTSNKPWTVPRAIAEVQPAIYLAALRQERWPGNEELRFRHLVLVKRKKPVLQLLETRRLPEDLFAAMKGIRAAWGGIERGEFPPNVFSEGCRPGRCGYWERCPDGGGKHATETFSSVEPNQATAKE
jgi:hypothetical protein